MKTKSPTGSFKKLPSPRRGSSAKRVGEWEEDALVETLVALLPRGRGQGEVHLGPGDDCAWVADADPAVEKRAGRTTGKKAAGQLLKVDALIEGVHFLREHPATDVGWKALARPLSDIGAMGGIPRFALITAAVPEDLPVDYLWGIYRGLARAARRFGVEIVGGETCRSPEGIFLSVTLTGVGGAGGVLTRGGAQAEDDLWVTGVLGGSYASGHHLRFVPRVREAGWLCRHFPITALMDLSDGLGADLPRLARRSGLGFVLEEAALPCRRGVALAEALGEGEDYELLFTLGAKQEKKLREAWRREFPRVRLTRIGKMVARGMQDLAVKGYGHFGKTPAKH